MNISLQPSDMLFATVLQFGRVVERLSLSGLASVNEALQAVASSTPGVSGLVRVELRNRTTGDLNHFNLRLN